MTFTGEATRVDQKLIRIHSEFDPKPISTPDSRSGRVPFGVTVDMLDALRLQVIRKRRGLVPMANPHRRPTAIATLRQPPVSP
ncbi:hypothetical protein STRIP9103_06288 [Streptomyces ipomoeae 91-03]|uniref:Uncharacterized protein n=1 Tax=Streptomyces ipomoeae 91-03 TaxID=698759 RepID=L1KM05_9ACTN|nr:hypothetical protein STRIP9103_06288 [Streptomyces ipomoeae 91-03]